MSKVFTGFSTIGSTQIEAFKLYDIDLVKQDLLNHFHTRIGERVMRPKYGCRIWDYLMEPFTESVRDLVVEEATRICHSDTRVTIAGIRVISLEQSIRVEMALNFNPFNVTDKFVLDFENRQGQPGF